MTTEATAPPPISVELHELYLLLGELFVMRFKLEQQVRSLTQELADLKARQ